MKQEEKPKPNLLEGAKKAGGFITNGYKAIIALASGDMDAAYNLTHKDKKQTENNLNTDNEDMFDSLQRPLGNRYYCSECHRELNQYLKKCKCGMINPEFTGNGSTIRKAIVDFECPHCKRKINTLVKKCKCGLEFK